ncbi:MAG: hypothetical protein IT258_08925 [Saprospiraceae bacterium]|nr:hypothetical protein [Saprospiraceae bacterium]
MLFHLRPANFVFWALAITASLSGLSFSPKPTAFNHSILQSFNPSPEGDSVQYRGYRLELTSFEVLKRNDDWVKLRFNIVNSGRVDVDFSKKGTEHWVQYLFDQSIFDQKLGGLRSNIQHVLQQEEFKLAVGKMERGKELKVPVLLDKKQAEPNLVVASGFETKVGETGAAAEPKTAAVLTGKNGQADPAPSSTPPPGITEDCPDIYFQRLRIVEQDDKSATLEFTIANKGFGTFRLFEKSGKQTEHLLIKSFISGVPTLSRGALPISEQLLKAEASQSGELLPGGTYTSRIKLDVRKKTRYMKSLILSLDSDQFKLECDKTNNTGAVILD